jgi:hypothetical protein
MISPDSSHSSFLSSPGGTRPLWRGEREVRSVLVREGASAALRSVRAALGGLDRQ